MGLGFIVGVVVGCLTTASMAERVLLAWLNVCSRAYAILRLLLVPRMAACHTG